MYKSQVSEFRSWRLYVQVINVPMLNSDKNLPNEIFRTGHIRKNMFHKISKEIVVVRGISTRYLN